MRRKILLLMLILTDALVVAAAPFVALWVRFDGTVEQQYLLLMNSYLLPSIFISLGVFYFFGLYRRLWQYASIQELLAIGGAVTASYSLMFIYTSIFIIGMPRSIHIITWVLVIMMIGLSRLGVRIYYYLRNLSQQTQSMHVLVIGAGDAGAMVARELNNSKYCNGKKLIGFVDDDSCKQDQMLYGARILGGQEQLEDIILKHSVNEIIIAMPSVRGAILRDIIRKCKETGCIVKTVPGMHEMINGNFNLQQLRNISLEDLLRREPVNLDLNQISGYIKGKTILVTGAGGSIGSEICRQIAQILPEQLILLGKGENSIYEIEQELKATYPDIHLKAVIADVRDKTRIEAVFAAYQPEVVFHAAAHKHVPLMEAQPIEAVKNNVFGTKTVAEAADRAGVKTFVMISTDKAVNPTSVMGATKRVAELVIQNLNKVSNTKFVAVRFGNVLGSRGSVVPLFRKQIARGGPITITHPEMKRYFMTIPEATQLVLEAGALAKGGEVFVLDMGEPVKILDMACDLIELSGLVPYKDIEIKFTGLRPGEKLFEELLTAEEGTTSTKHKKIFVANIKQIDELKLQKALLRLKELQEAPDIVAILKDLIPTYKSEQLPKVENQIKKARKVNKDFSQYKAVSSLN